MTELKNKAHAKMLEEMLINKSQITERLHVYLCNVDDEDLLNAILNKDKNLHDATRYLYHQGSKIADQGVADVSPEQEIAWCKDYYLSEKVDKSQLRVLPPEKGAEVIKEVKVVEEIETYRNPTDEDIADYIAKKQQKSQLKKEKVKEVPHQESLF